MDADILINIKCVSVKYCLHGSLYENLRTLGLSWKKTLLILDKQKLVEKTIWRRSLIFYCYYIFFLTLKLIFASTEVSGRSLSKKSSCSKKFWLDIRIPFLVKQECKKKMRSRVFSAFQNHYSKKCVLLLGSRMI